MSLNRGDDSDMMVANIHFPVRHVALQLVQCASDVRSRIVEACDSSADICLLAVHEVPDEVLA